MGHFRYESDIDEELKIGLLPRCVQRIFYRRSILYSIFQVSQVNVTYLKKEAIYAKR